MLAVADVPRESYRRIPRRAGWINPSRLPRGPEGRALCRRCGVEVPRGCRTFCGDACVHEWKLRTQPAYARKQVAKRDHGVCASCGLDTEAAKAWLRRAQQAESRLRGRRWIGAPDHRYVEGWPVRGRKGAVARATTSARLLLSTEWQADHIVPVVEGGGDCGLENLRTLCDWCHARETAALRARLSARRREGR